MSATAFPPVGDDDKPTEKLLLRAFRRKRVERPPFWFMRQAGRYLPEYRAVREHAASFLDLCYTPDLAVEVTLQPVRRFRPDAAILFSDILVVPHALGVRLEFREGEGPVLEPVRSPAALDRLSRDRLLSRLEPVYETLRRLRRALPADVALLGFAGAPWTLAAYMAEGGGGRDFVEARRWAYADRRGFAALVDLLVAAVADHLAAQIEAGAEAVQLFDSWAGVLPEDGFARWCIAPTREIVRRLKARHPRTPVIGFPRGAGLLYERYVGETGVDAVGLDTAVPPAWAAARLQPASVPQGNLDPAALLVGGAAMRDRAAAILAAFADGPFVFNLGHGVLPATPPEHVAELCDLLRGAGALPGGEPPAT